MNEIVVLSAIALMVFWDRIDVIVGVSMIVIVVTLILLSNVKLR